MPSPATGSPAIAPAATEAVAIVDYGSQTAQLIARRIREHGVYCELVPFDASAERVRALSPRGFVLSGGPASVYDEGAPHMPDWVIESGKPVLGICYGMQLIAQHFGGEVAASRQREYGLAEVDLDADLPLFQGLPARMTAWMSHGDRVDHVPTGFRSLGHTSNSPLAIMGDPERSWFAVQFHPEVSHTPFGSKLLRNFVIEVCGCAGDWTAEHFVESAVEDIRRRVGGGRVLVAVSGGVDSSVMAALVHRAVGDRMLAVFIDHGLLRQGEAEEAEGLFAELGIPVRRVDVADRFLAAPKPCRATAAIARRLLAEADRLYARAEAGIVALPRACRPGIYAARYIYAGIGRRIAANDYDSVTCRAVTSLTDKLGLMVWSLGASAADMVMPRSAVLYAKPLDETRFLVDAAARGQQLPDAWGEGRVGALIGALATLKARDLGDRVSGRARG